jgi:hypothetical protein
MGRTRASAKHAPPSPEKWPDPWDGLDPVAAHRRLAFPSPVQLENEALPQRPPDRCRGT